MSERGKIPQVGAIYRGSVPDTDPMYRRGWSVVSGSSRETIDQGSDTPGLDDRPRKAWPNDHDHWRAASRTPEAKAVRVALRPALGPLEVRKRGAPIIGDGASRIWQAPSGLAGDVIACRDSAAARRASPLMQGGSKLTIPQPGRPCRVPHYLHPVTCAYRLCHPNVVPM